jgi:hypothetical protein
MSPTTPTIVSHGLGPDGFSDLDASSYGILVGEMLPCHRRIDDHREWRPRCIARLELASRAALARRAWRSTPHMTTRSLTMKRVKAPGGGGGPAFD